MIQGGATIWARKTIDSEIFYNKPDKWFKIWFYIVNKVNHKQNKKWDRGQCHITYSEIQEHTGATKNQIDHCIRFLKSATMLATQKATRGMHITVINYNIYQDLDNYKCDTESDLKAKQKRNRSDTKNKNVKNDKYIYKRKNFDFNINKKLDVIKQDKIRKEYDLYFKEREKNNSELNRQIKSLTESKKI